MLLSSLRSFRVEAAVLFVACCCLTTEASSFTNADCVSTAGHPCDTNALCVTYANSFDQCVCQAGYFGDGTTCTLESESCNKLNFQDLDPKPVVVGSRFRNKDALIDNVIRNNMWQASPDARVTDCDDIAYITIRFTTPVLLEAVQVWHFYGDTRQYCSQSVDVSSSHEFQDGHYERIFECDTYEDCGSTLPQGRTVKLPELRSVLAIRVGSSRNNWNHNVHILEVRPLLARCGRNARCVLEDDKQVCACEPGFVLNANNECADVDECASYAVSHEQALSSLKVSGPKFVNIGGAIDGVAQNIKWMESPHASVSGCDEVAFITLEFEEPVILEAVAVHHFSSDVRQYCSQSVDVSLSSDFDLEGTRVFSCSSFHDCGDTIYGGRTFELAAPRVVRYIRIGSSRNNRNNGVHILEVEPRLGSSLCAQNALCENSDGSYSCVCPSGWAPKCVDMEGWVDNLGNQCSLYSGFSPPCFSFPDSLRWCKDLGYGPGWNKDVHGDFSILANPDGIDAGDACCECGGGEGRIDLGCVEVNECLAGTDNCSPLATCSNTDGSFTCTCNPGIWGDGVTCGCAMMGANPCGGNGMAVCTDTAGSHTCSCEPGDVHKVNDRIDFSTYCASDANGDGRSCTKNLELPLGIWNPTLAIDVQNLVGDSIFGGQIVDYVSVDGQEVPIIFDAVPFSNRGHCGDYQPVSAHVKLPLKRDRAPVAVEVRLKNGVQGRIQHQGQSLCTTTSRHVAFHVYSDQCHDAPPDSWCTAYSNLCGNSVGGSSCTDTDGSYVCSCDASDEGGYRQEASTITRAVCSRTDHPSGKICTGSFRVPRWAWNPTISVLVQNLDADDHKEYDLAHYFLVDGQHIPIDNTATPFGEDDTCGLYQAVVQHWPLPSGEYDITFQLALSESASGMIRGNTVCSDTTRDVAVLLSSDGCVQVSV